MRHKPEEATMFIFSDPNVGDGEQPPKDPKNQQRRRKK